MKRLLSVILVLALLMLPVQAGAASTFQFTRENFPRMDGSTSLVPLGTGITSVLLGLDRENAGALVQFNRTTQSFRNLQEGYCDIVIAAEPKNQVFDEMEQAHFGYEIQQIATEALVFVVNEDNPVDNLTTGQLQDIYAGKITNWAQVGGNDAPIEAFQRNATAGSQVMMEKLVMQGKPMMEVPTAMVPGAMAALIEAVKNYDNSANAIGYTVYYYAADMQMASGLKILSVDGVTPSTATLQDGSYPFRNGYYACIPADAAQGSPARVLYNWLCSEAGQRLLELEGYVPVYAAGEAPDSGENVRVDYSNYVPNGGQAAKYTLFDCNHDAFEPRNDYGKIYPYDGAQFFSNYEYDGSVYDYPAGYLQGFYTHSGELITNPIYTSAYRLPLDDVGREYAWVVTDLEGNCGFISKDGSFASGCCYADFFSVGDVLIGTRNREQTEFDLYDKQLNLIKTQADFTVGQRVYFPSDVRGGLMACVDAMLYNSDTGETHYAVLDDSGKVLLESDRYLGVDDNGIIFQYDEEWNTTLLFRDLTPVVDPELGSYSVTNLGERFYRIQADSRDFIIDQDGGEFEWDYDDVEYCTGGFQVVRGDTVTIYANDGHLRYREIPKNWQYQGEGIFIENGRDYGVTLHRMPDGLTRSFPDASYGYRAEKFIFIMAPEGDVVLNLDFEKLDSRFTHAYYSEDVSTGKHYIICYGAYGFTNESIVMDEDMKKELLRVVGSPILQDGYVTVSDDWAFRCYDMEGNLVFCYPTYGLGSGD